MTTSTEDIWAAFSAQLRSYIIRQVRDDTTADDILQEVFLKIHTHGATVRAEERLTGWLYQVTHHAIADYYRRRHDERWTPLPDDAAERYADPAPDMTEQTVVALLPCVRTMVEALPAAYREALLLTEYEGLTQKVLAERMGISISGAKTRVQRARQMLRSLLLACCHLEFDHAGRVIDYHPGCSSCAAGPCREPSESGASGCEQGGCTGEATGISSSVDYRRDSD